MKNSDIAISAFVGFLIGIGFFLIEKTLNTNYKHTYLVITIVPILTVLAILVTQRFQKKHKNIQEITKFSLIGVLNTIVDLGWLYFLIYITGISSGIGYSTFKALASILTSLHSYLWHKYWTFEKNDEKINLKEYSKFLTTILIGIAINVTVASTIVNIIGPQFNVSEIVWAGVGATVGAFSTWVWNFLILKRVVFKKKKKD